MDFTFLFASMPGVGYDKIRDGENRFNHNTINYCFHTCFGAHNLTREYTRKWCIWRPPPIITGMRHGFNVKLDHRYAHARWPGFDSSWRIFHPAARVKLNSRETISARLPGGAGL